MGDKAARITAADFVTPPELAGLKLAAEGAGRIGGVRLELAVARGQTALADSYQQVPLRVLPLGFGAAQPALIYLLNPTAGLFDGDAQLVDIQAGPETRALVAGQSATRIHPSLNGFSTQQWQVRVGSGAVLAVLPGPAIPFRGARYFQRVLVDLADDAHFIWGDVWLAGRYARGDLSERFQFQTLIQELHVRRAGRPIFRDRFCWQGPWDALTVAWHFGANNAYGSIFSTLGADEDTNGRAATFKTAHQHTCLRWLGTVQDVTTSLTRCALTLAARAAGGAEPWLLATHDLAPNHWFSSSENS